METRSAAIHRKMPTPSRQLPITGSAHKAGVVGDAGREHFSQRSTCPPSAAVRQLSIADITFNWSRPTWPALACRHAGPWPRKISATSNAGRDTRAALQAGRSPVLTVERRSSGLITLRIVLVATRV